ncbi:MAG: type I restriction-modification system subunit M [Aequorivita sp.]|nr:type I restriction-modification system subunit M [Aequorivita sp.]MBP40319.1 type I restriction-modification system subunit M [Aequorivita sp.]|tara:strand:+ start:1889 stop:4093 length:2205 start_codon:yes stop_codon:yes gene_type:complete
MSEDQKKILENQLWGIANLLRGKISADDYRDYILGFIFYKYLSEKQTLYANELLVGEAVTDYKTVTDKETLDAIKEESLLKLGYFLEPSQLFSVLAAKGNADIESESNYILEDLKSVLNHIEQSTMGTESEEDFNALFEDLDLNSTKIGRTVGARNEIIVKILNYLDKIDFKLEEIDSDVLGDAYEYLIARFAAGAGKSAGEFYTPQQVSKILSKIVTTGKSKIKSVYDPTCGSGSLLLRVAKEADVSEFYGQELGRTTYNLARMNMILHDVHFREFNIVQEDTLENPQHLDKRFEAVVANPPFSAHWKSDANPLFNTDERFNQYGRLAPKTKADYAFLTHMLYQLADNGIMASVFPHGVLYRGAAEGHIREYIIKEMNALDAVIGLPANIFYGTSIPTCIMVLKKCREVDDNIVFIDASGDNYFKKEGNQNVLRNEDVDRIVNTYRNRETIEKYSYVATLAEIAENEYNLNIPRYVDTYEEETLRPLNVLSESLDTIAQELEEVNQRIQDSCQHLNIPFPSSVNRNLLLEYKKSVQRDLFNQVIRFQMENGENHPDWQNYILQDIGTTYNGLTGKTKENFGEGLPYIQYKQIFDKSYIDTSKCEFVEILEDENQNRVQYGDIFFTTSSETILEVGFASVLLAEVGEMYLNSFCFGYRLNSFDILDPNFAQYLFRNDELRRKIVRLGQGSTRYNISKVQLMKIDTLLPSIPEQNQISSFLNSIDRKIELISNEF